MAKTAVKVLYNFHPRDEKYGPKTFDPSKFDLRCLIKGFVNKKEKLT